MANSPGNLAATPDVRPAVAIDGVSVGPAVGFSEIRHGPAVGGTPDVRPAVEGTASAGGDS